jgi:predicted HTH domain antitoxin
VTYQLITTRVEREQIDYITKLSKLINTDKSYVIRKIHDKGIMVDIKKALELYMKGDFSIGKAAEFAKMYIGEFYEFLRENGIESNVALKDFEESLKNI